MLARTDLDPNVCCTDPARAKTQCHNATFKQSFNPGIGLPPFSSLLCLSFHPSFHALADFTRLSTHVAPCCAQMTAELLGTWEAVCRCDLQGAGNGSVQGQLEASAWLGLADAGRCWDLARKIPPHLYSAAYTVYQALQETGEDASLAACIPGAFTALTVVLLLWEAHDAPHSLFDSALHSVLLLESSIVAPAMAALGVPGVLDCSAYVSGEGWWPGVVDLRWLRRLTGRLARKRMAWQTLVDTGEEPWHEREVAERQWMKARALAGTCAVPQTFQNSFKESGSSEGSTSLCLCVMHGEGASTFQSSLQSYQEGGLLKLARRRFVAFLSHVELEEAVLCWRRKLAERFGLELLPESSWPEPFIRKRQKFGDPGAAMAACAVACDQEFLLFLEDDFHLVTRHLQVIDGCVINCDTHLPLFDGSGAFLERTTPRTFVFLLLGAILGYLKAGGVLRDMALHTFGSEIPTWDGDPNTFERFATACSWYSFGLKDNERHLAAARIWNKMSGPAKGVVRHLNPENFASEDGVKKLLNVLRESPLQKLPIPDSFSRLEKWSGLQKRAHENIPQLFTELQVSLRRARENGSGVLSGKGKGVGFPFSSTPEPVPTTAPTTDEKEETASPHASATGGSPGGRSQRTTRSEAAPPASPASGDDDSPLTGFFEDELRGYRLLKACHLGYQALRSLFDEGMAEAGHRRPRPTWWADATYEAYAQEEEAGAYGDYSDFYEAAGHDDYTDPAYYYEDPAYYATEPDLYAQDTYEEGPESYEDPVATEDADLVNDEKEAFAIAQEANRTLQQARAAVAKARGARGYFPVGGKDSGKGKGAPPGKGATPKGRFAGGPAADHGNYFHDFYAVFPDETFGETEAEGDDAAETFVLSVGELATTWATQVIVDTGATESACGIRSMDRLLQALQCPFDFLLDDESSNEAPKAQNTPLLLGGRTLRSLQAILSYGDNMMTFRRPLEGDLAALPLYPTKNGHLAVDLSEKCCALGFLQEFVRDEFGLNLAMAGGTSHSADATKDDEPSDLPEAEKMYVTATEPRSAEVQCVLGCDSEEQSLLSSLLSMLNMMFVACCSTFGSNWIVEYVPMAPKAIPPALEDDPRHHEWLHYEAKPGFKGKHRTSGPPRAVLLRAIGELRMEYGQAAEREEIEILQKRLEEQRGAILEEAVTAAGAETEQEEERLRVPRRGHRGEPLEIKKPGPGTKASSPPPSQARPNSNMKKILAAGTAALFANLHQGLGTLLPAVRRNVDFLEVTNFGDPNLVDTMNLQGYDLEKFAPQAPGDLLRDVRCGEGRQALLAKLKNEAKVMNGLVAAMLSQVERGRDFVWEIPAEARCNKTTFMDHLRSEMNKMHHRLHDFYIDACAYGAKTQGTPVRKRWRILTTNKSFETLLRRGCPGCKDHIDYNDAIKDTMRADHHVNALAEDVEEILLEQQWFARGTGDPEEENVPVMALSRQKVPPEPPTGRKLEQIRQMMMRVHRASGHASMASLAKLLAQRGAPSWAQELARSLQCPDCVESRRPLPAPPPPSTLKEPPKLWEMVGSDVFEFAYVGPEGKPMKIKGCVWHDRASGTASVSMMQKYSEHWEPSSSQMIRCFIQNWLQYYPQPTWLVTDPALYYVVRKLKDTVERLGREMPALSPEDAFRLACHAHNSTIQPNTGFAPYQWSRGGLPSEVPVGIDPNKAFEKLLKQRESAGVAYRKAQAADHLSKLNNSVGRPRTKYEAGEFVMLWRNRKNAGKGAWTGPVRVIHLEGSTVWMASGATLLRAKLNQVRPCSKKEEMTAVASGASIYKMPVTMETLLRGFRGRFYEDLAGDNPPQEAREDLSQAEVRVAPRPRCPGEDRWEVQGPWLVRVHIKPRLALFTPSRTKERTMPIAAEHLTGERVTFVKSTGNEQVINDDFVTGENPGRCLSEAHLASLLKLAVCNFLSLKLLSLDLRSPRSCRRSESSLWRLGPSNTCVSFAGDASTSNTISAMPGTPDLQGKLVPDTPRGLLPEPSSVNGCPVTECVLPGGHQLSHRDAGGNPFAYDRRTDTRIPVEESGDETEEIDSSDSELQEDEDGHPKPKRPKPGPGPEDQGVIGYAYEIEMEGKDWKALTSRPRKAKVWLSKKLQEEGKEHNWRELTQAQKEEFDEAQAKEISNVIKTMALRSLTESEPQKISYDRVMRMRWVLTTKSSGTAKARLVILGYQSPTLLTTQSSSPTLSRLGKYLLLSVVANQRWLLESADVTSAFLQALSDLEKDDLYVFAPAELGAAFGGDGKSDGTILKVLRAFYGLVDSPRRWHETVTKVLLEQGWRQISADRCRYVLFDQNNTLVGIAGVHVDDFLVAGDTASSVYKKARESLETAFTWGRWEQKQFEYAGSDLTQREDFSIILGQESYTNKWIEEAYLSPEREKQKSSPLTQKEVSDLRGVLGTLSWRANQTSPQLSAEIGLLLSEVPNATVDTMIRANKMVREAKRTAEQILHFHAYQFPWSELVAVVWADAAQNNRPKRGSTVGVVGALAPRKILEGERVAMNIVSWRSTKAPRESLGSNGSEVQAITIGEDLVFLIRAMWMEIHGVIPRRNELPQQVAQWTEGALVMDSRGIYDAMVRNTSALHGLRSSRAGYELTVAVSQAQAVKTHLRWVAGTEMIADAMTKASARKILLQLMSQQQQWRLVYDPDFVAGRKLNKKEHERRANEMSAQFLQATQHFAAESFLPWGESPECLTEEDMMLQNLRSMTGVISEGMGCSSVRASGKREILTARQHGEPPSPYTAWYFSSDPVKNSFPENLWEPPFWDSGQECDSDRKSWYRTLQFQRDAAIASEQSRGGPYEAVLGDEAAARVWWCSNGSSVLCTSTAAHRDPFRSLMYSALAEIDSFG
ncbi:RE1 [Symbiodinium sp. CCMP2592]|nr:RE1 [Symbiodinium sp. CCMP2592]